jgi:hypothetical protein
MIRQTDMEFILMQMEIDMKDNGKMICKMEKELRLGRMARSMWGSISRAKRMGEVS